MGFSSRVLDSAALVFYFPSPATATGEEILELHVHGGPAIVRSVLEAIPHCNGARDRKRSDEYSHIRLAEPGEFTKRAFYNGRLDLTQAEALGDTLAAETEQQRRLAISGTRSGLAQRYEQWRTMLLYARGELEALIDFSEDQHFDESSREFVDSIESQIVALQRELELHIKNASRGELLRNGISIALLGAPNAGKSSLLNRIVGREAAIVSAEEGTTRDIVDVSVDIGGWLCRLGDMAGLRDGRRQLTQVGPVEQEGIRRAKARALQSDLVIVLLAVERAADGDSTSMSVNAEVLEATQSCQRAEKTLVVVINKVDVLPHTDRETQLDAFKMQILKAFPSIPLSRIFSVSCLEASSPHSTPTTKDTTSDPGNIQRFLTGLTSTFAEMTSAASDPSLLVTGQTQAPSSSYWDASLSVSHRQSTYLESCLAHLNEFLDRVTPPTQTQPQPQPQPQSQPAALNDRTAVPPQPYSHHIDDHDDLVNEVGESADDAPAAATIVHYGGPPADVDIDIVAAAEHLRFAAESLAKITGRGDGADVEDVLGVVFEK